MPPVAGGSGDEQVLVPPRMSAVAELGTADGTRLAVFADVGEGDGLVLYAASSTDPAVWRPWAELRHTWGLDVNVQWHQTAVDAHGLEWLDEEACGIEQALSDWRERKYTSLATTGGETR